MLTNWQVKSTFKMKNGTMRQLPERGIRGALHELGGSSVKPVDVYGRQRKGGALDSDVGRRHGIRQFKLGNGGGNENGGDTAMSGSSGTWQNSA